MPGTRAAPVPFEPTTLCRQVQFLGLRPRAPPGPLQTPTVYGPGTADALEERYRDSHFKGKITKEWSKKQYEAKIIEIKEKLSTLATVVPI